MTKKTVTPNSPRATTKLPDAADSGKLPGAREVAQKSTRAIEIGAQAVQRGDAIGGRPLAEGHGAPADATDGSPRGHARPALRTMPAKNQTHSS